MDINEKIKEIATKYCNSAYCLEALGEYHHDRDWETQAKRI